MSYNVAGYAVGWQSVRSTIDRHLGQVLEDYDLLQHVTVDQLHVLAVTLDSQLTFDDRNLEWFKGIISIHGKFATSAISLRRRWATLLHVRSYAADWTTATRFCTASRLTTSAI